MTTLQGDQRVSHFVHRVRATARACGYAIGVHGSQARDLDLVAVPWTPEATSADPLVSRLCSHLGLVEQPDRPQPERRPWGRLAWSLAGCPVLAYVDLNVAPRAGEAVPHA